jgi:hypothetical protein
MQATASILTDQFPQLLARLPAGLDLDRLAAERGALTRRREIKTGAQLLRLALARGPGGLSLREASAWAGLAGLARLSNPAVKYRLDHAADFLAGVVEQLLAAKAGAASPCWHGRSLRLADGTSLSQPGSGGTDWRVHAVFDLGRGGFTDLQLTDARGVECLTRGKPVAGEVRIADRYFARAQALQAFRSASDNTADFIVRLRWNALTLRRADGSRLDLIAMLRALPSGEVPQEVVVQIDLGRGAAPLPARLVILRKPPEAAEATRRMLQRYASRKQKKLDPRTLVAAEFMMLATSLPAEDYPADQVLAAYRLRWQIELAFKRLKTLLHIDQLPTLTPNGSRSWLYAHLVMALLCDDLSQDFLESFP